MKLSDAIRLGSMLRPQTKGALIDASGSCALGAAGEATGLFTLRDATDRICDDEHYRAIEDTYPVTMMTNAWHPEELFMCQVRHLIPHLNDKYSWTREAIADLVATIESQHAKLASSPSEAAETVELAQLAEI